MKAKKKNLSVLAGWRGKVVSLGSCVLLGAGCGPVTEAENQPDQPPSEEHHHEQSYAVTINNPNANAYAVGQFSAIRNWPIIPIAAMVQPNGKVFAYGTNGAGAQGAAVMYTIWDPVSDTFTTKDNNTHSDVFCAGQALIPGSGDTLMVGGDATINGIRNYAMRDVNILNRDADATGGVIQASANKMAFDRWYPTLVTLPSGAHVVLGGRDARNYAGGAGGPPTVETYSPIPEVRAANGTWRSLTSAFSNEAYGANGSDSWNYPRAWVNPRGKVFIMNSDGAMFDLDTAGTGTLTQLPGNAVGGYSNLTAVMFQPGKILMARNQKRAIIVDINGPTPVVTPAGTLKHDHRFGNSTVLADGKVWFNGGSPLGNQAGADIFESEMYDPQSETWKVMAVNQKRRLYHSTSMLLPDGTVFTGGGGAPGPSNELNAEIYFPPYLFKKNGAGSQLVTVRPTVTVPAKVNWGQTFNVTSNQNIQKVTLVRIGGSTHNFNNETRFYTIATPATPAKTVSAVAPAGANVAPPGFYMVFAWDTTGVPSIAKIIRIDNLP